MTTVQFETDHRVKHGDWFHLEGNRWYSGWRRVSNPTESTVTIRRVQFYDLPSLIWHGIGGKYWDVGRRWANPAMFEAMETAKTHLGSQNEPSIEPTKISGEKT